MKSTRQTLATGDKGLRGGRNRGGDTRLKDVVRLDDWTHMIFRDEWSVESLFFMLLIFAGLQADICFGRW
jgi:hypothetical protein